MKILFASFVTFFIPFLSVISHAQIVVNGADVNQLSEVKFCEISSSSFLSNTTAVRVDYGQPRFNLKRQVIRTKNGKIKRFNSMVAALNFMTANGWEYISNRVLRIDNDESHTFYLFKRKE